MGSEDEKLQERKKKKGEKLFVLLSEDFHL